MNWKTHCYKGPCYFERPGENHFLIRTDSPNGRGSWFAYYDQPFEVGDTFIFHGRVSGPGVVKILFFDAQKDVLQSIPVHDAAVFTIPQDTHRLRLDLRLWGRQDTAEFQNVALIPNSQFPIPDSLPIPPPDMTQKHHVSGWKWGNNIALTVHGEQIAPPNYGLEDQIIPYEVRGFQHGRNLDLQIGNMNFDEEEE